MIEQKAVRKIVNINEELCTGCGDCVPACAEGALQIIDGKAKLVKEVYCDGLGDCLGDCPEGAITIEEREADEYSEEAVEAHLEELRQAKAEATDPPPDLPCGCPGSMMRKFSPGASNATSGAAVEPAPPVGAPDGGAVQSRLGHWPVQIHLLPPVGDIWNNADVLIAADCVPFAMPDFHQRLLAGKTVAVGCPKLDDLSAYENKLAGIFKFNNIHSVTVARMEVPCCSGIAQATKNALKAAGKDDLEFHDVVIGVQGTVLSES